MSSSSSGSSSRMPFMWQAYITKLAKLVTHCGGGTGVPLIKMMDRFAKNYGANKVVGEEMITTVVVLHVNVTQPMVMLRVAAVLTNLAADKVVDGVTRR